MDELTTDRGASLEPGGVEIAGLKGDLKPFQQEAVQFAAEHGWRVLIGDEMGTGKTLEAIAAVEHADAFPCVIVCPATLKLNWRAELRKFMPGRLCHVVKDGKDPVPPEMDYYIINYDLTKGKVVKNSFNSKKRYVPDGVFSRIFQRFPKSVIVDESHYCKSETSKRTIGVQELCLGRQVVLLLSGTPIVNRPAELIPQLRILGRLDREWGGKWAFAKRYCRAHRNRFGWDISGAANLEELGRRLRSTCMIRRTKKQVLPELGEKSTRRVLFPISNRREYDKAEKQFIKYVRELQGDEAAMRARRAEAIMRMGTLRRLAGLGKVKAIAEWVRSFCEQESKLILFAHHIEVQEALVAEIPGCVTIMGADSLKHRQQSMEQFQNDDRIQVVVCSLKAASEGITLTAGSNVAFAEYGWTPKDLLQASDRAHRIGQTEHVTVWAMVADRTIDRAIEGIIARKISAIDRTLNPGDKTRLIAYDAKDEIFNRYAQAAKDGGDLYAEEEEEA